MGDFKYKAFISYSHKDRKWTRWLHRRLETYPIPKNIIGKTTPAGIIPKRLKPIFRDREELSASNNLGEKIQAALASSKNLIIICSPAAAQSKWVNQEILTFKQNNRDAQLFSVIVEGEPYASTMPGREAEECFPPALRFEVNEDGTLSDTPAEPLAADLRPHADGKRLGFLKLLSGMIGVGLDDVVQRDMKRSRKRVTAITTGSLATVLAMGTLTGFALDARNDAEGLIDFMQTDLKDRLVPVGRTDILDGVARKSLEYYESRNTALFNCGTLGRYARSLHFSSEVNRAVGNYSAANKNADKAEKITKKRISRCFDDPKSLIDHSNSLYYQSEGNFNPNDLTIFDIKTRDMKSFVDKFCEVKLVKDSKDSKERSQKSEETHLETCLSYRAYVQINLGAANLWGKDGDPSQAVKHFNNAIRLYEQTPSWKKSLYLTRNNHADAHGWLADSYFISSDFSRAAATRKIENDLLIDILKRRETNFQKSEVHVMKSIAESRLGLVSSLIVQDNLDEAFSVSAELNSLVDQLFETDNEDHDIKVLKLRAAIAAAVAIYKSGTKKGGCQQFKYSESFQTEYKIKEKVANDFFKRLQFDVTKLCNQEPGQ